MSMKLESTLMQKNTSSLCWQWRGDFVSCGHKSREKKNEPNRCTSLL